MVKKRWSTKGYQQKKKPFDNYLSVGSAIGGYATKKPYDNVLTIRPKPDDQILP